MVFSGTLVREVEEEKASERLRRDWRAHQGHIIGLPDGGHADSAHVEAEARAVARVELRAVD